VILSGAVSWWRGVSRAAKIVSYVGVAAGALVAVAQAAPYVEPYWYAHRGYVRAYDDAHLSAVVKRVIQIQLNQDRERRQQLLDEAAKRELELQSDQAKQLPQYHALVQERVDRVKSELKALDEQDQSLFSEQKLAK
jgi:hypothetical protein